MKRLFLLIVVVMAFTTVSVFALQNLTTEAQFNETQALNNTMGVSLQQVFTGSDTVPLLTKIRDHSAPANAQYRKEYSKNKMRRLGIIFTALGILGTIAGAGLLAYGYLDAPNQDDGGTKTIGTGWGFLIGGLAFGATGGLFWGISADDK